MNIQRITCVLSILAVSVVAFPVQPVQAQSGGEVEELEELITIGTRREGGRSTTDSLVPVDVLSGDDLLRTGNTDIVTVLTNLVPSYNANTQAINDAATLVRPAQLRGLPPDSTLVLVNGKRRHRAAVITFLGNGISDGAQGADISTIPAVALKRVEVLRDGAAAQYGSDAIAGVMNFELKDDAEGGSVEARWGQHYEGDGDGFNFAGNIGLPLGSNGFANLSAEYRDVKGTNRSVQRSDAERLIAAGNTAITDPNYDSIFHPNVMIWGAPEVKYDYKIFGNFGMDLSDNMEVYGHTNYAKRKVEGGFFFRNPHTRNGVFNGDVVDGNNEVLELQALNNDGTPKVDDNNMPVMESFGSIGAIGLGGPHDAIRRGQLAGINIDDLRDTVKVADIGGLGTCSPIRIDNDVAREGDITAVENDDNCQSFITRFPGGFTPRFGGVMEDYSFAVGVRGDFGDWYV
ncbi:MAG: TonB-dependent receptor plug domain-containing protein, partial [Gammaproteobacteria bacterium]